MRRRNLFMSLTLMCGFLCLAFSFGNTGIKWLWTDIVPVAYILGIATFILGVFWMKASKKLELDHKK